ncbi:centrosomal protein of 104 kDa isoform X1 [Coregonus clupeaformis]|uniref:centrosomal protein of 104 kDa isoform X1 n=1 Tax=Coregonus clupeaformis TaxID=59861 RepID=UPI001BE11006|nr:centrosomal protein of 104 kDa isoform X1 [Coregonus clupeaformis]
MPRKIGFTLVSSSGHEDNFSAKELMVHAPTVNGWRSARFCPYPQQVTLQLSERSRVRKLQLLAHQYLISGKIEFHIGDRLPEADSPGLSGPLRRLGYVSLSDNEKTGFKARELKSVHVDAIGTYIRITFHRNHVNRYNLYNQVALVAINVLGDSVDGTAVDTIPSRKQLIEHYLNSSQHETALDGTYMGKCESISPLDDLAFDMYQDPEVAHIIRLLDDKKQEMVHQELYEFAKTLKQAIADLQKVGERLGRYDVEKCCAIEKEDYDTAKKKKEQMEEYRMTVYHQLEVHNLLDMGTIRKIMESPSKDPPDVPSPRRHQVGHKMRVVTETRRRRNQDPVTTETVDPFPPKPVSPLLCSLPLTPRAHPAVPRIDVPALPYDERPLPALQRKGEMSQSQPEESSLPPSPLATIPCSPGVTGEPEPLTERAQREASFPVEVYGDGLVAGAYSKTWSYREDALLAVYKKLTEVSAGTPKEKLRNMMRAAVFLVKKALKDKVSSVFQASLKLLQLLLTQLIPGQAMGRAEMAHCVEQTWPNLLSRTGDSATRLRAMATAFIQDMALFKEVRALQLVPGELVKPIKSNIPTRQALSRAKLLEKLLGELGTDNSGFTLDNVMKFCTGALQHSASEVRETAVLIILAMYRLHKNAVLSYLPANDAATRKNVLYKNIFDGFARIDGRPVESQTSKKGGAQQEGEKEKEEIHSLQEQLAALKEISEKGNSKVEKEKGNTKGQKKEAVKAVKTGVKTAPQINPEDAGDNQSSVVNNLDNLCIFCGEKDESFTEDGLDLHYWKHCPMLHRCDQCRQVVEIASLSEHLLGECENRARFSQCPRCSEAVPMDELTRHTQSPACNPPGSVKGSNHCPLCHNNFMPGEEAWKAHLMSREGCKQNSRRAQQAQGKPGSVAKLKHVWSVGSRGRVMGKGSRIPALAPRASRTHTSRLTPVKR